MNPMNYRENMNSMNTMNTMNPGPMMGNFGGMPPKTEFGDDGQTQPFTVRDSNSGFQNPQQDQDMPEKEIKKEASNKRGMGRLRARRGAGRSGKLTKAGLDMQSFYKTKICPYLLAVRHHHLTSNH